jgi:anti-sigma factor RsiW
MTHLRAAASALVDGELHDEARAAALAHLARCESCRREVEQLRQLKLRLRLGTEVCMPDRLLGALAGTIGQQVAAARPSVSGAPATPTGVPAGVGSSATRPPRRREATGPGRAPLPRRRVARPAVGVAGVAASVMLGFSGVTAYAMTGVGTAEAGTTASTQPASTPFAATGTTAVPVTAALAAATQPACRVVVPSLRVATIDSVDVELASLTASPTPSPHPHTAVTVGYRRP